MNDETFRRSLRPFPQFQQFQTNGQFPLGRYKYHGTDISVEKRASHGLTLDFSYSLVRQWDDYSGPGVQDYFDRDSEWSISNGLRPHRLSLTYSYELPFGEGKPMLRASKLRHLLGNWSVSGFTRWRSGHPVTLRPEFNNTGGVVRFLRVNAVPGVDPGVPNPGPELFFNPLAFVDPSDFTIGDVSRTHPTLRNPGWTSPRGGRDRDTNQPAWRNFSPWRKGDSVAVRGVVRWDVESIFKIVVSIGTGDF